MPTELGTPFAASYRAVPTHMSWEDFAIWQRYRLRLPADVEALYFDVRLGEGRVVPEGTTDAMRRFWYQVTTKRADVIIKRPGVVRILELRESAQLNAVGRLLGYKMLYEQDPPWALPLEIELATNEEDPDVRGLAEQSGILYTVLPPEGAGRTE